MAPLRFSHALVCRIARSFSEAAKAEHEIYIRTLRDLGLDVIEMPPDDALPSSVYIEDTAVICNGIALITKPKDKDRLKEVEVVRAILKKELELTIVEIDDKNAFLEGGDVLFTGEEFFVGISEFTNEAGARALAAAFPEFPCAPIKVDGKKHLKAFVSMAGPQLLCVSSTKSYQDIIKRIEREASFSYQTLTVPEEEAVNVLYINGTLVHRTSHEIPLSFKVFSDRLELNRKSVSVKELCKDSWTHLSSCALLRPKSNHNRIL